MTISNLKKMIRISMTYGMAKERAFQMAAEMLNDENQEKQGALERFRYEINAEEQRRSNGGTTQ